MKTKTRTLAMGLRLFSILLVSLIALAASEDDRKRELGVRMDGVRFPSPLTPIGETTSQQFTSILLQISSTYAAQWKQPLPIVIDLEAAHRLAHSKTDLKRFIDIPIDNTPLPEMLRGWCDRAELQFAISGGQIIVSPASNP